MVAGDYYKILADGRIVGGFIVRLRGYRYYEVVRIFVYPEFQNRGIGTRAFEFLWSEYPDVERWTLGTPAWNRRNRHFYKKVGFVEVGEDRRGGILLERNVIKE
jgi:GNAT superfamily N-acetyltransferase